MAAPARKSFRGPGARDKQPPMTEGRPKATFRGYLAHLRTRSRILVAALAAIAIVHLWTKADVARGDKLSATLQKALVAHGLLLDGTQFCAVERSAAAPFFGDEFFFVARPSGNEEAPTDVFRAVVRHAGGSVLGVRSVRNLTNSSSASEGSLGCAGRWVGFESTVGGQLDAVVALDTEGESKNVTEGWSLRTKLQNKVTNWQDTGHFHGFGRHRFRLKERASVEFLRWDRNALLVVVDGGRIVLRDGNVTDGLELVEALADVKGAPGTISWVVDTVRKVSWIGAGPIEWLEHRVFAVKDWSERSWFRLFGDASQTDKEVAEEMALPEDPPRAKVELSVKEVKLGFPPAQLESVMNNAAKGEGEWRAVEGDPYLRSYPGAPTAFYQSFLRADPERPYTRVYMVVWDPRQIQLNIMTGTREPQSATGETGPGMAPREPQKLKRVVAGFNGGFQAEHGEFGMMSGGRVYLPPKPWAATVAVDRNGTALMGSWFPPPDDKKVYEESWAVAQIPPEIYEFRQNLTSVVENRRFNPWERWWWGAAPVNADEQTYIDRSGLCLTEEGFFVYFWGKSMGPEALGKAMSAARCARGMHLDMNSSHTGFEFYNVQEQPFATPLPEEPTEDEFEGRVPLAPELYLRARRAIRTMSTMRFPRYVGRDSRDFFYLTQRPILPGPPLVTEAKLSDAGVFSSAGLPHDGFPFAFARTRLGDGEQDLVVAVRIDPSRLVWTPADASSRNAGSPDAGFQQGEGAAPLAYFANLASSDSPLALALFREPKADRFEIVRADALREGGNAIGVLWGQRDQDSDTPPRRLITIGGEGFLVYLEAVGPKADPRKWLAALGAESALVLGETRLVFQDAGGAKATLDGFEADVDHSVSLALLPDRTPFSRVLAPDNKPRPYWRWAKMQDTRVRYFKDGPPRFTKPDEDAGVESE